MGRYFEDFAPDQVLDLGSHTFTKEDIIAFAKQFDPQPFHTDEEAAKKSVFGGLIASGWHTGSVVMRLAVDTFLSPPTGSIGSPGIDELRWLAPVRPGDTLHATVTVLEVRRSQSKPDRGVVKTKTEATNQRGEVVYRTFGMGMFLLKNP